MCFWAKQYWGYWALVDIEKFAIQIQLFPCGLSSTRSVGQQLTLKSWLFEHNCLLVGQEVLGILGNIRNHPGDLNTLHRNPFLLASPPPTAMYPIRQKITFFGHVLSLLSKGGNLINHDKSKVNVWIFLPESGKANLQISMRSEAWTHFWRYRKKMESHVWLKKHHAADISNSFILPHVLPKRKRHC